MLNQKFLLAYFGTRVYTKGVGLYNGNQVSELEVREDPDTGIVAIQAYVHSAHYRNTLYEVNVKLSADENWIIDCQCTCPYYESYMGPCKHIAAVLLKYIDEANASVIGNGMKKPTHYTDSSMTKLLSHYIPVQDPPLLSTSSFITLEPHVCSFQNNALEVSFALHQGIGHKYIIKNLQDFCAAIQNHSSIRYGKSLEFIHSLSAFDSSSRPMIQFLMNLANGDDTYSSHTNVYYRYDYMDKSTTLTKSLSLKGRYLDEFFRILDTLPAYFSLRLEDGARSESRFVLANGIPRMQATLRKCEHGYLFSGTSVPYAVGNEYLYFLDIEHNSILYYKRNDDNLLHLLSFFQSDQYEHFISDEDIPAFTKYVYPTINENMQLSDDGFEPSTYTPEKPSFSIYLDQRYDQQIVCTVNATYSDQTYNLCEEIKNNGRRDIPSESEMLSLVTPMFNGIDHIKNEYTLTDNDDLMYQLLTEGIPLLQQKASVFISEKLKKLQVKPMPKISVGVSVSHDLLQLDFVTDTMSEKQLSEILSRYDSKKKYYRLKNGDFLTIDQSLDELQDIKDSLSLTSSQIANGSMSVPFYRAQYLEELANKNLQIQMNQEASFQNLVEQMHTNMSQKHEVPSDLHAQLRPYQKDGFDWLCALRDCHFAGLLADEMGLGKTLQVIAFLGSWTQRERSLIVCPASLVYNWSAEIQKFMPSLPSRIISGSASMRAELIRSSQPQDILITSYDLLKRDMETYQEFHFSCEVIDEAQYIKNAGTQAAKAVKEINAQFKVALTGTPIENRLSELWSIFDYLLPGFFYGYQRFRNTFEVPIIKDEDEQIEQRLKRMITPFVLRRLKKDVLKDLPDKLEEVYYASCEDEQKELYDARVQNLKNQLHKQSDKEFKENKLMVLAELTRLRQICCDPSLVYDHYHGASAKADLCVDMIRNAVEAGHKVLLFSQFTSMLDILTIRLQKEGIAYHLLEGSTPKKQRADMVESFQKDDVPVFCISLKAGGTGLNLTAADIVIHYDPWWNTAVENQASDRAHRIGQKNVVSVYRLIMKDTIEEKILELQQSKNDLANKVLSGQGISSAKLTKEDLLHLLD